MEFAGALVLTYGFEITEQPALLILGQPVVVLEAKAPWALYLGWALLVLGFLLQIVSEVVAAIRSTPE
jgi:hypothetical protein